MTFFCATRILRVIDRQSVCTTVLDRHKIQDSGHSMIRTGQVSVAICSEK